MQKYEFRVNLYSAYGTFNVDADSLDEAYNEARNTISNALWNCPVDISFDVDCVYDPGDPEDDD